jgi:hypothetical protein
VQVESNCDKSYRPVTYLKSSKIIANHYNNKTDFSTLYIKADAKYSDDRSSQNVTAEIRIKKDEQILVIRFELQWLKQV